MESHMVKENIPDLQESIMLVKLMVVNMKVKVLLICLMETNLLGYFGIVLIKLVHFFKVTKG